MAVMNTSVSGMMGDSNWLSSISQNVANSNTTGYKNVDTEFTALVDQAGSATDPGMGVSTGLVHYNSVQGSVVGSSTNTNLAIQGSGFFLVSDSSGTIFLTRNGSFTPDASGNLVNSAGDYLMGYAASAGPSTNSLASLQKVNVTGGGLTATATTTGSFTGNLPSTAVPVAAANLPSANSASSVYTDATSVTAYDDLGAAHTLDVYFTNTGSNTWEVDIFDHANASASGGFPYSSGPLATQTLTFNPTTGALTGGSPISISVPGGSTMSLSLGSMTQLASSFTANATSNGNAPETISGYSFSPNGTLTFQYSSGPSQVGFYIPLGNVPSPDNLTSSAGGALAANAQSGSISIGTPGTGGLGQIEASSLENSTVDLATELTEMIQAQSAYEANSKVFQTGANIFDVLNQIHA